MNRLYIVVSETLTYIEPVLDYGQGETVPYRIIELVVAGNRSQAKVVAAKYGDDDYRGNVTELPRMWVRLLDHLPSYPQGLIVSNWKCFRHWWRHPIVSAMVAAPP